MCLCTYLYIYIISLLLCLLFFSYSCITKLCTFHPLHPPRHFLSLPIFPFHNFYIVHFQIFKTHPDNWCTSVRWWTFARNRKWSVDVWSWHLTPITTKSTIHCHITPPLTWRGQHPQTPYRHHSNFIVTATNLHEEVEKEKKEKELTWVGKHCFRLAMLLLLLLSLMLLLLLWVSL